MKRHNTVIYGVLQQAEDPNRKTQQAVMNGNGLAVIQRPLVMSSSCGRSAAWAAAPRTAVTPKHHGSNTVEQSKEHSDSL